MEGAQNYLQLLADRAAEHPDRIFWQDVGVGDTTYKQMYDLALTWAEAFRKAGVNAGDTVVTMHLNSARSQAIWLGLGWLKAIEIPINADFRGRILEYVLNDSQAQVLVIAEQFLERLAELGEAVKFRQVIVLDSEKPLPKLSSKAVAESQFLAGAKPATGLETPEFHDMACVLYTSGTTGPSKGVLIPWGQLHAVATGFMPVEDLTDQDAFYAPTPTYHVGSKGIPYLMALVNGRVVVREVFSVGEYWSDIEEYGATTAALVGAMAIFLQRQPPKAEDAKMSLRNAVMAPLIPEYKEFAERFGLRVCTAYNMTEISNPLNSGGWEVANAQTCGRVREGYPGYEVRVVDEHDYEVPPGVVGELIVRTSVPWTLNAGYFGLPDKTTEAWRNGWFHTGDGFKYDEDGNFYFVDRIKDAIRRRGENISSFELEAGVNDYPSVLESAAIAVPSEHADDEVKVCVVPKPGESVDPKELMEFLISTMPRFMIPRYIEIVESLPKTATQRVRKHELRENPINQNTWDREAAGIKIPR